MSSPAPKPAGLSDGDPAALVAQVLRCWDLLLNTARALADTSGLTVPSRLPGWTARDICTHLGRWEDQRTLDDVLAAARSGSPGTEPDPGPRNDRLVAAHRGADDATVLRAVEAARDSLAAFATSAEFPELARVRTSSIVGPLPLVSVIHGGAYELAAHALDLVSAGAPMPDPFLLSTGLAAVVDITGALAAGLGLRSEAFATTPVGGWRFRTRDGGWTTEPVAPGDTTGCGISGTAVDILDAAGGRVFAPKLLATRRLRAHDLPAFLRLTPIVERVPNLPGGPALHMAARALGTVRRFPGFGRH